MIVCHGPVDRESVVVIFCAGESRVCLAQVRYQLVVLVAAVEICDYAGQPTFNRDSTVVTRHS